MSVHRPPTVLFPEELLSARPTGPLYGYAHPQTGYYNILGCGTVPPRPVAFTPCVALGKMVSYAGLSDHLEESGLVGWYTANGIEFSLGNTSCSVSCFSLVRDVFSRNTGILESDRLQICNAVISGCGSVGSLVGLELAKAGVGGFLLVDPDVFAYHNICRHHCGVGDVGRWKVDALRDRILDIQPGARVECQPTTLQRLPKQVFDNWCSPHSVLVGCGDNRECDIYGNKISCLYRIPFVSIGLWERAFAGELFWSVPPKTACYYCVFSGMDNAISQRATTNRQFYTEQEDVALTQFEPGISVDIGFVTNIGCKILLDLLSEDVPNYIPRVHGSLKQFTLICNSNDPRVGSDVAEIFDHPLQVTRSIEVRRMQDCPHCRLAMS